MSSTPTTFPIYRQLVGGKHLYRIDAEDRFVELQRIGSRWVRHEVVANQYPEKLKVQEMIYRAGEYYGVLSGPEWSNAEREHACANEQ